MTTQLKTKNEIAPQRLAGKTALITGGSRGIGAAIALRLAQEGANVAINYNSNKQKADEVVAQITELGGKAFAVKGNVVSNQDVQQLVDDTIKQLGHIDILINNAGVYEVGPLEKITIEQYNRVFDVNVKGVIATTIAALPKLTEGGRIINVSSVAGRGAYPEFSVYSASKAALDSLTRTWAQELGKRKITVNAVAPGPVKTDMFENVTDEMKQVMIAQTALGRIADAEEIASVVAFLASDDGRWVTGQTIYADGGLI